MNMESFKIVLKINSIDLHAYWIYTSFWKVVMDNWFPRRSPSNANAFCVDVWGKDIEIQCLKCRVSKYSSSFICSWIKWAKHCCCCCCFCLWQGELSENHRPLGNESKLDSFSMSLKFRMKICWFRNGDTGAFCSWISIMSGRWKLEAAPIPSDHFNQHFKKLSLKI